MKCVNEKCNLEELINKHKIALIYYQLQSEKERKKILPRIPFLIKMNNSIEKETTYICELKGLRDL